jgi:tRNA dimethylallyltransferase
LASPTAEFSVSEYLRAAARLVHEIVARQRVPIFVGGTPLWLMGLVRGMYVGPPADWDFRREVEAELQTRGVAALRERLWQVDPLTAHRLHDHDTRRMIRALEVARATGKPLSHQQSHFDQPRTDDVRVFVLTWPRHELHQRINRRVEQMFEQGLIAEVEGLLKRHDALGRTASQAVGYREVIEHLQGKLSLKDTIAQVKAHTRQLAKRQETWLRGLPEARWITMSSETTPEAVCQQIIAQAKPGIPPTMDRSASC